MTEKSLKQFIIDYELEWHWVWSEDDVYLLIPKYALGDFSLLLISILNIQNNWR